MTTFVVNSAQDPVTLVPASLIPISGHPTGHLINLAVARAHDGIVGHGWPPGVPFRSFRGARLPHGQSNVISGFEGPDAGRDYLTAGAQIRYRYHGQLAWPGRDPPGEWQPRHIGFAAPSPLGLLRPRDLISRCPPPRSPPPRSLLLLTAARSMIYEHPGQDQRS